MVQERVAYALLFEDELDQETLVIECYVEGNGRLHVVQRSSGPWSSWCFEDDSHCAEIVAPRETVDALCAHFNLAEVRRLPAALQVLYAGFDATHRIRGLMASLRLGYEVRGQETRYR